jgi:hypothetical protein
MTHDRQNRLLALVVILLAVLGSALALRAQERIDLTTPVQTTVTNWSITTFTLRPRQGIVYIRLVSNLGDEVEKVYDGTTNPRGSTLISNLNTANLSTRSLEARIYDRLIADGVFAGTVAGTPR